jgi:hypothetical protein
MVAGVMPELFHIQSGGLYKAYFSGRSGFGKSKFPGGWIAKPSFVRAT